MPRSPWSHGVAKCNGALFQPSVVGTFRHMMQPIFRSTVPASARWCAILAACLVFFAITPTSHAARIAPVRSDIAYGPDPSQTLDVYLPATPGPHRLVVFLHGGGWTAGSKGLGGKIAPPIVAAGYALASVEYRKVPQTDPAGATQDAARAIAYLLANAGPLGFDGSSFALLGHSSGAHMVALLGTDASYLKNAGVDPKRLVAVIPMDGVFDVTANLTHYPKEKRFTAFGHDAANWRHLSPAVLLASATLHPRFCALHDDTNSRFIEQATLFEAALRGNGANFETGIAHGLSHGEVAQEFSDPGTPMAPFVLGCLSRALPAK
jgi:arylformamidase